MTEIGIMKMLTTLLALLPMMALALSVQAQDKVKQLKLNDEGYFHRQGLDVMLFSNNYAQGHQGGVEWIQHGERIATVGDVRLEPTPGQWSPQPKLLDRQVHADAQRISATLQYPDESRNRKGFNPIIYPDLHFKYDVSVEPADDGGFWIQVDLQEPLPDEWYGKVGFNLELFPGLLFGKKYMMDGQAGIFPRSPYGKVEPDEKGEYQAEPYASGKRLVVAPESEHLRFAIEAVDGGELQLYDSRFRHNNGFYVVRALIPQGAVDNAIRWKVTPNIDSSWKRKPVVQVSQVGYHPDQKKRAVVETDSRDTMADAIELVKVNDEGDDQVVLSRKPESWGKFLRYQYYMLDFTGVTEPGLYYVRYGETRSHSFRIDPRVFDENTWEATLEYFLPVQMCHMKVNEKYRTWHGRCHLDDALMAPTDTNHFDGYIQGPSTLTDYEPYDHVPGLNAGGWHDAGDFDLRVESQAGTVHTLALIYDEFGIDHDQTTIDQDRKLVEIHQPDGKPDVLQQIEHGLLTILGGYDNLGRLYRGIITNDLRKYVLLGDPSTMTDNKAFDKINDADDMMDDRWVFTEENPGRALYVVQALAAAGRVLGDYDADLAQRSTRAAQEIFANYAGKEGTLEKTQAVGAAAELYLTTGDKKYLDRLVASQSMIVEKFSNVGWMVARVLDDIDNTDFRAAINGAMQQYGKTVADKLEENPYGVPYDPAIWGAGWTIEDFAVSQYYLFRANADLFPKENFINGLDYVLGFHQGENTKSFVSGVGTESATTAYGFNRADWSFIPGGVISGTGLIRPDFPELKHWPYFWQQTEYVMGGAATNFMFLSIAADRTLNK